MKERKKERRKKDDPTISNYLVTETGIGTCRKKNRKKIFEIVTTTPFDEG